MAVIELVELSLTIFAAEAQLVLSFGPGELVGEVASDVVTTFGGRQADGIEVAAGGVCATACGGGPADGDVRSVREGGAGDESEALNVLAGLVVVEDLIEVVDSGENLVRDAGRYDAVVDDGDVLYVDWSDFVVSEELGSDGRNLIALSDEPVSAEVVFIAEAIVNFAETVPAVSVLGVAGVKLFDRSDGVLREHACVPRVC